MLITNVISLKPFKVFIFIVLALLLKAPLSAQVNNNLKVSDTTKKSNQDSLRYAIKDRRGDFLSQPSNNPFDLRDTSLIKRNVEYDPVTKQYFIREFVNGRLTKVPASLSFKDFWKLKYQDMPDYQLDALVAGLNIEEGVNEFHSNKFLELWLSLSSDESSVVKYVTHRQLECCQHERCVG